ncbi:putative membrane protein [Rhodovulum iodosum]|uniref:Membrane protein n=1 Tax=Rhodovulum iodosum TaxID=68291 RepID=A0ABV3XWM7_9RHOB|nr:carotenoid biosynthesis protein [Rhodovulum robiginosum]RSK41046.1 carotenoid biosynthesis protein [Rhodovulum robiginosum]
MEPDFTGFLVGGIVLGTLVTGVFAWRFGPARAFAFVVLAGLFSAGLDFLSAFEAQNYAYPGQTRLWVFTYIFFGWIGVCGTCLLVAEGLLARRGEGVLTSNRLRLRVPLLTAVIAVLTDLYIDPIAVEAGYWRWFVPANVYYGIPLLNFVGWFVLMLIAPLAWIEIARRDLSATRMIFWAFVALPLAGIAAVLLSLALNGLIGLTGLR